MEGFGSLKLVCLLPMLGAGLSDLTVHTGCSRRKPGCCQGARRASLAQCRTVACPPELSVLSGSLELIAKRLLLLKE